MEEEKKDTKEKKKGVRPNIDANVDGRPMVYDDWEGSDRLLDLLYKHHSEYAPPKS